MTDEPPDDARAAGGRALNLDDLLELHQSTLSLASKCGLALEHWLMGRRKPPAVAMTVGTATHVAVSDDLRHKIETRSLLPDDAVKDAAAAAFEATWDGEEPRLTDDELQRGAKRVRGEAKDLAVSFSSAHHARLAPALEPLAVERELRAAVPSRGVLLVGTLDVLEGGRVRDLKTKSRKSSLEDATASHQFDMYALLGQVNGHDVKMHALDTVVATRRGVAIEVLEVRAAASFDPLLFYVERVARMIRAGVFVPVDATGPSGWTCSERWCGYFDECPMGRARRKVFVASTGY